MFRNEVHRLSSAKMEQSQPISGVGKCPHWTSPKYWGYNPQERLEVDVKHLQNGTFANRCIIQMSETAAVALFRWQLSETEERAEPTSSGKGTAEGLFPDREHHILRHRHRCNMGQQMLAVKLEGAGVMDRIS